MTKELIADVIQWDVKSWKKTLLYWEQAVDWSKVGSALELGGRQGGLSLWLALKGIPVVCSDLTHTEETARPLHEKYDVGNLITYENIDASAIPYENRFDVIVFKSIIGGIGRSDNLQAQEQVFREIRKALKPGGKLLFAENLVGSALHGKVRKRFVDWGNQWRYVSLDEMKTFLAPYSDYEIRTSGVLATFGRSERQRDMLAVIDNSFLNALTPDKWKYICYGIAEK